MLFEIKTKTLWYTKFSTVFFLSITQLLNIKKKKTTILLPYIQTLLGNILYDENVKKIATL